MNITNIIIVFIVSFIAGVVGGTISHHFIVPLLRKRWMRNSRQEQEETNDTR